MLSRMTALLVTYPVYAVLVGTLAYALVAQALWGKSRKRNPKNLPLPPGPKGYPIIGNLLDMPQDKPWIAYNEWSKTYGALQLYAFFNLMASIAYCVLGDMIYFEVLGQPFMVLGSLKRTSDLFDKRSSNYSDRMRMPMVIEL